jgi:hypothetical protein
MDPKLKKILRGISLEIRRLLEGRHDEHGQWVPGDLEERLKGMGVWRAREPKPVEELPHLSPEDKAARRLVDGYLKLREEAGVGRTEAVAEFVRESAYTWANRLFALRCMEARGVITDEVILQKQVYGWRSLLHSRFAKKNPQACAGEDDGLFAVLFEEFGRRAAELPGLFDPRSPAVALKPSVAALKRTIALLGGREAAKGQDAATDEVFSAPDAFGWAYQYWNADEKNRVFEMVRVKKGAKIEGADIVPATQLYTEPYMVKFLVQNSLGALWMGMYPESKLCGVWEYYVGDADRASATRKPVREVTFLDPAQGSGHFHLEAFDVFFAMYEEEAAREHRTLTACEVAASILNNNLYGIDIDGRSVQIAAAALWMKAKERAPDLEAGDLTTFREHLVATNIRLPKGRNHLELFLEKHPEDKALRPALEMVFEGLEHADELGALLQIGELVDAVLRRLKKEADAKTGTAVQAGLFEPTVVQGTLSLSVEDYDRWKRDALDRLQAHFGMEAQAADPVQAFFGESAGMGLTFFNLLARRYDVVTANPPYMGSKNMGDELKSYILRHFTTGKRDLYAAFMLRCVEFAQPAGRVAMVTQQSWMFLRSFAELCAVDSEKLPRLRADEFNGLLRATSFEVLAHLGAGAFEEISGEVVKTALIVLAKKPTQPSHRVVILAPEIGVDPSGKAEALRSRRSASLHRQMGFVRDATGSTINYWVPPELWDSVSDKETLSSLAKARKGITTMHNQRFVRWAWEVNEAERWKNLAKSLSFVRWQAPVTHRVEWAGDGVRVKTFVEEGYGGGGWSRAIANADLYFAYGSWCSIVCGGNPSFRLLKDSIFETKVIAVVPYDSAMSDGLLAYLNTRLTAYLLRAFSPGLETLPGAVESLPVPVSLEKFVVPPHTGLLRRVSELSDVTLPYGVPPLTNEPRVEGRSRLTMDAAIAALGVLCTEAFNENQAYLLMGVTPTTRETVQASIGVTAALLPLLSGYDSLPPLPTGSPGMPREVLASLEQHERRSLAAAELADLSNRLRQFYEAGPGASFVGDEEDMEAEERENEEEETVSVGGRMPIPVETFIEELSQKLEIHPISVYWLLKEGIERDGWRCLPEERRLKEDWFSALVLRLLGHRWPKQLEARELLPAWADQDGVIALTEGGGETPLIERVQARLAGEFPGGSVPALQGEFEDIVGLPLEQWLTGPFFERHLSQFRKRPIAWQIETNSRWQMADGRKRKHAREPVFACLIYYHKLDEDLLPKIRTHYAGVLREGYETELRTLERLVNATPDQQGRRLVLEQWVEELKGFDEKLEMVSSTGFGPQTMRPALRQYGIEDALLGLMAGWLRKLEKVISGQWPVAGAGKAAVSVPLAEWCKAAEGTGLHADLRKWVDQAFKHLDYFCAMVGPEAPKESEFAFDPISKDLAPLVCASPAKTVERVLDLACDRWWQRFGEIVLDPLKRELKRKKAEQEQVKEQLELGEVKRDSARHLELADRRDELKREMKRLKENIEDKTDKAKELRSEIEAWTCPEAATWEDWLGTQSLFDGVASLDGKRKPPVTIAEFVAQESAYAPDINDGVRVNIAPLQKEGLLHADVLDFKDAEKAIADRAEWRADERRWVREGKLPQPGWWPAEVR